MKFGDFVKCGHHGKDAIIAELRALVKKQGKLVEKQAEQIAALTKEVEVLKLQLAKTQKDSSTSSKSPSSDITKPKKEKPKGKPGSHKKPKIGGQPGRQRKLLESLPPERVNKTIIHELDAVEIDQLDLVPTDLYSAGRKSGSLDVVSFARSHLR